MGHPAVDEGELAGGGAGVGTAGGYIVCRTAGIAVTPVTLDIRYKALYCVSMLINVDKLQLQ